MKDNKDTFNYLTVKYLGEYLNAEFYVPLISYIVSECFMKE